MSLLVLDEFSDAGTSLLHDRVSSADPGIVPRWSDAGTPEAESGLGPMVEYSVSGGSANGPMADETNGGRIQVWLGGTFPSEKYVIAEVSIRTPNSGCNSGLYGVDKWFRIWMNFMCDIPGYELQVALEFDDDGSGNGTTEIPRLVFRVGGAESGESVTANLLAAPLDISTDYLFRIEVGPNVQKLYLDGVLIGTLGEPLADFWATQEIGYFSNMFFQTHQYGENTGRIPLGVNSISITGANLPPVALFWTSFVDAYEIP